MSERTNFIRNNIAIPSRWATPISKPNQSFNNKAGELFIDYEHRGRENEIVNSYTTTPKLTSSMYDYRTNSKYKQLFDH